MKTSTLLIAGGVLALGLMMTRKASAATVATRNTATRLPTTKQNPSTNGMLMFGTGVLSALSKSLGATWNVNPATVETVDYSQQGYAIGDYAGMTQDQANAQAVTDFNNQFISPYGASAFQWNG